jgi:hypothetical protein
MARNLRAPEGEGKMTQIPIRRSIELVPGGMMIGPLVTGCAERRAAGAR